MRAPTLRDALGISHRSLLLFRLVIFACVLFDLWGRSGDLAAHYADSGVLPRKEAMGPKVARRFHTSLHFAGGSPGFALFSFAVQLACAVGFAATAWARWRSHCGSDAVIVAGSSVAGNDATAVGEKKRTGAERETTGGKAVVENKGAGANADGERRNMSAVVGHGIGDGKDCSDSDDGDRMNDETRRATTPSTLFVPSERRVAFGGPGHEGYAVALWVLTVSLHARNTLVVHAGDKLLRMLLLWSVFIGDGGGSGRRGKPSAQHYSAGTAAILVQSAYVYIFTALHKSGSDWRDGTAVYQSLSLMSHATPLAALLRTQRWLCEALTYSVWYVELVGGLLLLAPVPMPHLARLRVALVAAFVGLNVGFGACLRLGIFGLVSTAAMAPFVPECAWVWVMSRVGPGIRAALERCARAIDNVVLEPVQGYLVSDEYDEAGKEVPTGLGSATKTKGKKKKGGHQAKAATASKTGGVIDIGGSKIGRCSFGAVRAVATAAFVWTALAYVTWWNIGTVYPRAKMPGNVALVGTTLWINQRFDMFAPIVPRDSGWFVFPAVLADGTEIDLFRELVSTRSGSFAQRHADLHRGMIEPGLHGRHHGSGVPTGGGNRAHPGDTNEAGRHASNTMMMHDENARISVDQIGPDGSRHRVIDDPIGDDVQSQDGGWYESGDDSDLVGAPSGPRTILGGPAHLGPSLVDWQRVPYPSYDYTSLRWRKYLRAILRERNAVYRPMLMAYLCRTWNSDPELGGAPGGYLRVGSVRLEFVTETNAKPYRTLPPQRTLFYEGECEQRRPKRKAKKTNKNKKRGGGSNKNKRGVNKVTR